MGAGCRPAGALASRARRQRKLGLARMRSGDTVGAMEALQGALVTLGDTLPRRRLAMLLRTALDAAAGALWRLLGLPRAAPDRAPLFEETAVVHRELGQLFRWVDLERSAAHHTASARAAGRIDEPGLLVDALASIAMFLAFISSSAASLALERLARRMARSADDRVGLGRILILGAGVDLLVRGEREAAIRHLDEGVALIQSSSDRMLHGWTLSWRGWAGIFTSRFAAAVSDFDQARAVALDLNIEWLAADAACGKSLVDCIQGRFDEATRAARALLASDIRIALPAIEALSTEILGAVAFMNGRFRDALAELARARVIYKTHHLERGWGYLIYIEEAEALLGLADHEGPDAVPDLLPRLLANARATRRNLGRLPTHRGCDSLLLGVYHARCGRTLRARRLFDLALSGRPEDQKTYIDTWLLWRIAIERRRMGDPRDQISPLFDEVERINERLEIRGTSRWLAAMRRLHDA